MSLAHGDARNPTDARHTQTGFKMLRESSCAGVRESRRNWASLSGRAPLAGDDVSGRPTMLDKLGLWSPSSVRPIEDAERQDVADESNRGRHWPECRLSEHCDRVALRHEAGILHHRLLSQRGLLLLGRRRWLVSIDNRLTKVADETQAATSGTDGAPSRPSTISSTFWSRYISGAATSEQVKHR